MAEQFQPQEFSTFLPGLLRVYFDALAKKWRHNLLAHVKNWTQLHHRPDGLNVLDPTTPWQFPSLEYGPAWLYGFMAFLVLCMVAQLIDLGTPGANAQTGGRDSRDGNTRLGVYEEALAAVFIPVEECHPKDYKPILKSVSAPPVSSACGNPVLRLDLENTWKALVTGRLELKDDDILEELFTLNCVRKDGNNYDSDEEGIWAFGCQIAFGFGWRWKMSVASSILSAYGTVLNGRFWWRFGMGAGAQAGRVDVPNLDTCLIEDTLDLDFIPIPSIPSALAIAFERQFTLSDPAFGYVHDGLAIEFTCLAPGVRFMSMRYLLCCAILLPSLGHNTSKSKKTAFPFFASVEDVIKRLESVSRKCSSAIRPRSQTYLEEGCENKPVLEAVEDISALHAEALDLHESDMVFDRWVRSGFVARHGPQAWRETRLRLKWEAALLRAKVLVRFRITMMRRDGGRK